MEAECLTDLRQMGVISVKVFMGACSLLMYYWLTTIVKQMLNVHGPLLFCFDFLFCFVCLFVCLFVFCLFVYYLLVCNVFRE